MDEATLCLLLSANVTPVINHNTHNYIIINKINDVCDLCETFVRLTVDHGADRCVSSADDADKGYRDGCSPVVPLFCCVHY